MKWHIITLVILIINLIEIDLQAQATTAPTVPATPTTPTTPTTHTTPTTPSTAPSTEHSTSTVHPTTEASKALADLASYKKIIENTIEILNENPNFSKPERERLESYLKTIQTLINAYNSSSVSMRQAVVAKFEMLKVQIDAYLKEIRERLPKTHMPKPTTKAASTTKSTNTATSATTKTTDHHETVTTPKPIDPVLDSIKDTENLVNSMIAELEKYPIFAKTEIEQLKDYKSTLITLLNAYKGSPIMKNSAIKKFNMLKPEICDFLNKINERLPTPIFTDICDNQN